MFSSVWYLLPTFSFSVKKQLLPPKHNITRIKKLGFEFFEREVMGFWKSLGYGVVEEEEYSFNRLLDRTITSSSSSFRDRDSDLVRWPSSMGQSQTRSQRGCSWFLRWWEHGANGCPKSESPGRKPTTNLISMALPLSTLIQTSSNHWFKPQ